MRSFQNIPELALAGKAKMAGWVATKRGWPDFICFGPNGEVILVEVKPRTKSGKLKLLSTEQERVIEFLVSKGIRCYMSDGITLEPYNRDIHADPKRRFKRSRERQARQP